MKIAALLLGILLSFLLFGTALADSNGVLAAPLASIPAGYDLFETNPEKTQFNFTGLPIPSSFFAPGSQPFSGTVQFCGEPIGTFLGNNVGSADTIVERMSPMLLDGPPETVPIELVQLSLVSCNPITVTYPSGPSEEWNVDVSLSPTAPSTGQMQVTKTHPNGGTFQSVLQVYPKFTFTRISDNLPRTLDVGSLGLPPLTAQNLVLQGQNVPWAHTCPPGALQIGGMNDLFCASANPTAKVISILQAPIILHSIRPAQSVAPEMDVFPNSKGTIFLVMPGNVHVQVDLFGRKVFIVDIGDLRDTDSDTREQVPTEMVAMDLSGTSPTLGTVNVRLRSPLLSPFQWSLGEIEETSNTQNARLDLPPFAPSGTASSFFDVFFEVEFGGQTYHNGDAKREQATISHKPPAQGEAYVWTGSNELLDSSGNPSGIFIIGIIEIPDPPPPPTPTSTPTPVPPTPTPTPTPVPSVGGWGLLGMAAGLAALAILARRRRAMSHRSD
ncbi:MAG: hypothetical protein Q7K03_01220 [Dehalococcoidia bacterium]|nr:hypothetical protein [Dehalococcoidia bacterium]